MDDIDLDPSIMAVMGDEMKELEEMENKQCDKADDAMDVDMDLDIDDN